MPTPTGTRVTALPANEWEATADSTGVPTSRGATRTAGQDQSVLGKGWPGPHVATSEVESVTPPDTISGTFGDLKFLTAPALARLVESRYVSPTKRWEVIQKELRRLETRSAWIAQLPDDWDECGTPAFDKRTIRAALSFVGELARLAVEAGETSFPMPRLSPGIEGAIDVYWEEVGKPYLVVRVSTLAENSIAYFFQRSGQTAWLKAEFPHSSRSRERALRSLIPWILP